MTAPGASRPTLVLATANEGKVAELRHLLGDRYHIEPRPPDLADTVEDGETLESNALKKAREVARHAGALAVADDTGLFVEGLGGRPGVHTARYAGPAATADDNVDLLLQELASAGSATGRRAEFRTVIAAVWPDGRELTVAGAVAGSIAPSRRGSRGFGYDPVFAPLEGDGRTFAEMSAEEKHGLSHRGRAIAALLAALA
ncbi:MAG: RdgB/HAM1 family non-canonical purine NTP pyrophosphatase [Acidimicrobiales bacterium]